MALHDASDNEPSWAPHEKLGIVHIIRQHRPRLITFQLVRGACLHLPKDRLLEGIANALQLTLNNQTLQLCNRYLFGQRRVQIDINPDSLLGTGPEQALSELSHTEHLINGQH